VELNSGKNQDMIVDDVPKFVNYDKRALILKTITRCIVTNFVWLLRGYMLKVVSFLIFCILSLSGCSNTSNITEHCTSWYPTKKLIARIHLTDKAESFYRHNLTDASNTFVFKTIKDAQLAGFDMTKDDCDRDLCLEFKEVKTGPLKTSCQPTGIKSGSICNDGTWSPSAGRGACSHHGGVKY
jgi:hypothetical protein